MSGTALVVAGALVRGGRLLLARRQEGGVHAGLWELPGGKVEPGETPEEALDREWREELGVRVPYSEPWTFASFRTDTRHVTLLVLLVRAVEGEPGPVGVPEVRWSTPDEAAALPLLPADGPLVERLARTTEGGFAPTERGARR
jgi:8-oxo-dGTP diphosphatase